MDYAGIAAAIAAAVFWAKGAEMEKVSPLVWVGISVILSAVVMFMLHGSWVAVFAAQLAMFVGITVFRVVTDKGKAED